MPQLRLSLPAPLGEFVKSEIDRGNYSSAKELFRELVRERQKRKFQEETESVIFEVLDDESQLDSESPK